MADELDELDARIAERQAAIDAVPRAMAAAVAAGHPVETVAIRAGVTRETVRRAARKYGAPDGRRNNRPPPRGTSPVAE